jgi:dihydrofolate synthase/folylpolyglutamate synthase
VREGRELHVTPRGFTLDAQRVDLAGPGWGMTDVACGLLGVYQPGNTLLAAAAARELGADEAAIREGLRRARWPGRFQIFRRDPLTIFDGAHNPAGARALAASLRAYFPGRPVTFVIGILADKDAGGILAALRPLASRIVLTASTNPRAAAPAALRALLPGARVETADSPKEALARARPDEPDGLICVAGSLSLVGDVLAAEGVEQDVTIA